MGVLPTSAFTRIDESSDECFYQAPRFVTHIDAPAIEAVMQLYRERIAADSTVLDLMSSWTSHLPPEVSYAAVVGLGMNQTELESNPQLTSYVVHDLNAAPELPFDDATFDAAVICVSVQYLTTPVAVMRELARVMRPRAPLVITFSNRCFPTKVVALWNLLDDNGHSRLISRYLADAKLWTSIERLDRTPGDGDVLRAVIGQRSL